MWANFNYRKSFSRQLPDILTGGTPENGSAEDKLVWLKVLIGYTTTLPSDLDDETKWPILPEGISRDMVGQTLEDEDLRIRCAEESVAAWLTDELIEKSLEQLKATHRDEFERFSKLSIVYPTTYSEDFSTNHVPGAMGRRLEEYLSKRLPNSLLPLEVFHNEKEIYAVSKAPRGVPKHGDLETEREKRYYWGIHRIAGQPWIRGEVEKGTLYWLVDDGTTIGSTMCNFYNHITVLGGKVGAITTLTRRYNGAEILKAQPESIEFLMAAIRENFLDRHRELYRGDPLPSIITNLDAPCLMGDFSTIQTKLGSIGLSLQLEGGYFNKPFSPAKAAFRTSLTNQEILILGAYFMKPEKIELWKLLDKALRKTGSCIKTAQDSYPVKLGKVKPGHIEEFPDLIDFAISNSRQITVDHEPFEEPVIPGRGSFGVAATFCDHVNFLHSLPCDYNVRGL